MLPASNYKTVKNIATTSALDLTQETLMLVVSYDKETGVFTNLRNGENMGITRKNGYIQIKIKRLNHRAHRLAWLYVYGHWPNHQIDHINGIRSDNRICNLRDVTNSINQQNKKTAHKQNKCGFLGVEKRGSSYRARIKLNGLITELGSFNSAIEAHQAYLDGKRKIHLGCTI